jgi:hypothetical protein
MTAFRQPVGWNFTRLPQFLTLAAVALIFLYLSELLEDVPSHMVS